MNEEALSIEEIKEKYKGEWVAIRVIERNQAGQPVKATVITSPDDPEIINQRRYSSLH